MEGLEPETLTGEDRAFFDRLAAAFARGEAHVAAIGFPDDGEGGKRWRAAAEEALFGTLARVEVHEVSLDPFLPALVSHLAAWPAEARREAVFSVDGFDAPDMLAGLDAAVDILAGMRIVLWFGPEIWPRVAGEAPVLWSRAAARRLGSHEATLLPTQEDPSVTATTTSDRAVPVPTLREMEIAARNAAASARGSARVECLDALARLHLRMGRVTEAKAAVREADREADEAAEDALEARAAAAAGELALATGRLGDAHAHFARALESARIAGEVDLEARLLVPLGICEAARGDLPQARTVLAGALRLDEKLPVLARASARRLAGDAAAALPLARSALADAEASADPVAEADARLLVAALLLDARRFRRARVETDRGLEVARRAGDLRAEADALALRAEIRLTVGDASEAEEEFLAAADAFTRLGDRAEEGRARHGAARAARAHGDRAAMRRHGGEALALFRAAGNLLGEAACLGLSAADGADEAPARAQREILRKLGAPVGEAACLRTLAVRALASGNAEAARETLDEAMRVLQASDPRREEAWASTSAGGRLDRDLLALLSPSRSAGEAPALDAALRAADLATLCGIPAELAREAWAEALVRREGAGEAARAEAARRAAIAQLFDPGARGGLARELFEEALPAFYAAGDAFGLGSCLFGLGRLHLDARESEEAARCFAEAQEAFHAVGAFACESMTLDAAFRAALAGDDAARETAALASALSARRARGDVEAQAALLLAHGQRLLAESAVPAAAEALEEARRVLGDRAGPLAASVHAIAGEANRLLGNRETARICLERASRLQAVLGDPLAEARTRAALSAVLEAQGDLDAALREAREAEQVVDDADDPPPEEAALARAFARLAAGRALRRLGRHAEALELLATAAEGFSAVPGAELHAAAAELARAETLSERGDSAAARAAATRARELYAARSHRAGIAECDVFLAR